MPQHINRLFLSSGINHSLNIATVIQQIDKNKATNVVYHDYLVVLLILQNAKDNLQFLQKLGLKFKKIVYSENFLKGETPNDIAAELQGIAFDEVYSYLPQCTGQYVGASTKVFLIDEGLTTYINIPENQGYLAHFLHLPQLSANNLEKTIPIAQDLYVANLKKIQQDLHWESNAVLYIGGNKRLAEIEKKQLIKIINKFIDHGYMVYFKLHPRNTVNVFTEIQQYILQPQKLILVPPTYYLMESLLLTGQPQKIFGFISTALINAKYMFNVPSYFIPYQLARTTYYFNKVEEYSKYLLPIEQAFKKAKKG